MKGERDGSGRGGGGEGEAARERKEKMRGKIRAASPHGEVGNRNCCW